MVKVYSIISGKGGTGKTTSAVNLAAALNFLGEDTVVIDANLSTPNIGLHLGSPITPITLNHVLNGKADIIDAIYEHESGLKIIPSSLSIEEPTKTRHERLADIIKQLRKLAFHVILDSSPGLGKETEASINAADEAILVTQAEMPAVTDALRVAKLVEQLNKKTRGFIITRYRGKRTEMKIDSIKDMLELPLLSIVPEDKNIQRALFLKKPIIHSHPKSKASRAYKEIAEKLLGKQTEKQGFFSRFLI